MCGGKQFEIISHRDRLGQPLETGLCLGCGLIMHVPPPSEEEIARYYAEAYRRNYHGESRPSNRRIMRAWNNGERIFRQISPFLSGSESVFEIGAGIGCTVKAFEMHGFNASGIEPNRDFNSYSRNQLRARIENRNLYELDAASNFDLVLLIHVIEHFASPARALGHIHALIRDGGMIYIECPNITGPFATFSRMFHYAHIYNFTPATLEAMAGKCGFERVSSLSSEHAPDIQMLFKKAAPDSPGHVVEPDARAIRKDLVRYNSVSYHLRPTYLMRRARKLWSYLLEYLQADRFVARLLKKLARNN